MAKAASQELRDRALSFRSLAENGDDFHLKASLMQLAEEFDQEAVRLEIEQAEHRIARFSAARNSP